MLKILSDDYLCLPSSSGIKYNVKCNEAIQQIHFLSEIYQRGLKLGDNVLMEEIGG